ncbi:MAG: hypothetical protein M1131_06880 [Actinobacteria bacterium]|nr:hypothetical protein [Actinomycetota bacterium]
MTHLIGPPCFAPYEGLQVLCDGCPELIHRLVGIFGRHLPHARLEPVGAHIATWSMQQGVTIGPLPREVREHTWGKDTKVIILLFHVGLYEGMELASLPPVQARRVPAYAAHRDQFLVDWGTHGLAIAAISAFL